MHIHIGGLSLSIPAGKKENRFTSEEITIWQLPCKKHTFARDIIIKRISSVANTVIVSIGVLADAWTTWITSRTNNTLINVCRKTKYLIYFTPVISCPNCICLSEYVVLQQNKLQIPSCNNLLHYKETIVYFISFVVSNVRGFHCDVWVKRENNAVIKMATL